jgi:hypothetical protein
MPIAMLLCLTCAVHRLYHEHLVKIAALVGESNVESDFAVMLSFSIYMLANTYSRASLDALLAVHGCHTVVTFSYTMSTFNAL